MNFLQWKANDSNRLVTVSLVWMLVGGCCVVCLFQQVLTNGSHSRMRKPGHHWAGMSWLQSQILVIRTHSPGEFNSHCSQFPHPLESMTLHVHLYLTCLHMCMLVTFCLIHRYREHVDYLPFRPVWPKSPSDFSMVRQDSLWKSALWMW